MDNSQEHIETSLDALRSIIERPLKKEDCDDKDNRTTSQQKDDWDATRHKLLKARYSNDTVVRIILACSTQFIIMGWLICVLVILMGKAHCSLSDSVLITLLGTTTTTIIGLALIVLRGFFQYMKQDVELNDTEENNNRRR